MEWWKIAILALVGLIVLAIILHYINRRYKIRYNYSLYPGGFTMIIAAAAIVFGYILRPTKGTVGLGLMIAGALLLFIVIISNIKHCGFFAGIGAILAQVICGVACIFVIFSGRNSTNSVVGHSSRRSRQKEQERIERIRREKGYNRVDRNYANYDQRNYGNRDDRYYDNRDDRNYGNRDDRYYDDNSRNDIYEDRRGRY